MTNFETIAPRFMGRLMDDFDLTHDDAAAIVGNSAFECEGFDDLTEDKPLIPGSRGGYGYMMWTGPRRRAFEAWCKRKGWKGHEFEANYSFLFRELIGPEGRVLAALRAVPGIEAKTETFMRVFLRPGIPHLEGRIYYAKRCLQMQPETNTAQADAPAAARPVPTGAQKEGNMVNLLFPTLIRHGLTVVAGALVTKGLLDPGLSGQFVEVGGGIVAGVAGAVMSMLNAAKTRR